MPALFYLYIALIAEVDLIAKINREQELSPEHTCTRYSAQQKELLSYVLYK